MMDYVAGLLFESQDTKNNRVALIRKNRPEWQKGRLNAIGGKIEPAESPLEAMNREFKEETGLVGLTWDEFATLRGDGWNVHFFRAFGEPGKCNSTTDEQVEICSLTEFASRSDHISNLKWLIPLSLNMNRGVQFPVEIAYTN